ncbi:MAG: protein kinase [Planctomycetes bacterium]|nr:protein kinase [Planctomycetota bacterium]
MTSAANPEDAGLHGLPMSADPENLRAREPLEVLVSRFSEESRRGLNPSIEDYARRYAEWADQIRELFPLIETLESWKSNKEMECLRRSVPQEFPIRQLGTYRLVHELGRGGMGIVFEALDESTGRRRAIKLLPWRYATDMAQWQDQFQREARTIAGLRHPNIVRVYAFGTCEGYCYYVMDLIPGVSLDCLIHRLRETTDVVYADEIQRAGRDDLTDVTESPVSAVKGRRRGLRRDSWTDFARIALPVAQALSHAHEAGVLHNDIKPANLLLDINGKVVVTDFGIGRRVQPDEKSLRGAPMSSAFTTGAIAEPSSDSAVSEQQIGTLRYMAPERLLGRRDIRSDVYALGVTLYELVTQTPAFVADDRRRVMELILNSQFRTPRQLVPQIPRGLETIILNAMLPDPGDRYPSAEAMAVDLAGYLKNLPIEDRRPSLVNRTVRWFSRRP